MSNSNKEMREQIDNLRLENSALARRLETVERDRNTYGGVISRIRENLLANSIGNTTYSTTGLVEAALAVIKLLKSDLLQNGRSRIGDSEKAGAILCRAEKAEAEIEATWKELGAAGHAFVVDTWKLSNAVDYAIDTEREKFYDALLKIMEALGGDKPPIHAGPYNKFWMNEIISRITGLRNSQTTNPIFGGSLAGKIADPVAQISARLDKLESAVAQLRDGAAVASGRREVG